MMRKFQNSGFVKGVFIAYIVGMILTRILLWALGRAAQKVAV